MFVPTKQYNSINAALAQLAIELVVDGDKVQINNAVGSSVTTKELLNYHLCFAPGYNNICTLPERKFPKRGAKAEFLWYMSGNALASAVTKYLPNWAKFADENGAVNSNYGCYWRAHIPGIIEELKKDKNSRRAVMNIFHAGDAPFGKDTPCTLSLQFIIRQNKLHLMVLLRSNDIWYGLSIDQFCNSLLHQLVYNELKRTYADLELGWYAHNAGSMHVYMSASDGNACIEESLLAKMFQNFLASNEPGERFVIPENVGFNDFWEHPELAELFGQELYDHFKAECI